MASRPALARALVPDGTNADGERVALAAFVAGTVLAGGNAVGVRFSNRELEPLWGAGLRFSLAAAVLVAVMGFGGWRFRAGGR